MTESAGESRPSDVCPVAYPFRGQHRLYLEPDYADARRQAQLMAVTLPVGGKALLASTHAQVRAVLANPHMARQPANQPSSPRLTEDVLPQGTLLALDGDAHGRLRRPIASAFTARNARALRPHLQAAADRFLDELEANIGPTDLIEHYLEPLTVTTTAEILGIPQHSRHSVLTLVKRLTRPEDRDTQARDRSALEGLLDDLTSGTTLPPGLLDDLARTRNGDAQLSLAEVTDLVVTVYAGGRTPTIMLASAALLLLTHTEHLELLRNRPDLWETAVDELLRYVPVGLSGGFPRVATSAVDICGSPVEKGKSVLPATISANFDERVFPNAEHLELARRHNPHLAFGYGPHRCPGAPVSRILIEVALRTLIERLPDVRISEQRPITWHSGLTVRALAVLPVEW
ncbi:cytochrome P450 [Streptomyces parvulus]|uniref:cytochrome P450 n=1 Tax=Streptomyces parvulus TaxID=146923 RepID=UPI003801873B